MSYTYNSRGARAEKLLKEVQQQGLTTAQKTIGTSGDTNGSDVNYRVGSQQQGP